MMATFGLEHLSVEGRPRLVEELWDSIPAAPDDLPVTETQQQDLHRRLDA